tara:strand:- start:6785 stop:8278 length:1494 start_codon:yes stop_codon:yes gene_type:complete
MKINYCLNLNKLYSSFSIWPVVLFGLILRLVNINAPVIGVHSWRQADTASIAKNFLSNNLNLFQPQVNWSGATNGLVESEFPLYQYLVANIYKIFGFNEVFARLLSVLFGCLSIFFLFRLIKQVFSIEVAWWGSLFYAILPISVYYNRTIQPESLMIFLGIFSLERWMTFLDNKNKTILFLSWISFTLAVLIKVLPLFWIGLPILVTAYQRSVFFKFKLYILPILTILISYCWYSYSYKIGQLTGLTFGLWGADTDRYSWLTLLELRFYIDLFIRLLFRNFLLIGFLPFCLAIKEIGINNIFSIGIISVFITGLINPISFSVHEYYQLPLMIFICPLMGLGFVRLKRKFYNQKYLIYGFISLLFIGSLIMLKVDYWNKEVTANQPVWETAELIKNHTNELDLVVSVTGRDPTLLYLSHRKGWLALPMEINQKKILEWKEKGAKYIAGSWSVVESYNKFTDEKEKIKLYKLICRPSIPLHKSIKGCQDEDNSYLMSLN